MELDKAELVDKLAQHRTENATVAELEIAFYEWQYNRLDSYTEEELYECFLSEIDES